MQQCALCVGIFVFLVVGRCYAAHFLLIHGAWQGAWVWDFITPLLTSAGHNVSSLPRRMMLVFVVG